jgi:predicted ATPase
VWLSRVASHSDAMRVVITGGPGAGKTTLLSELARRGFATAGDTPRAIIRSRRARGLSPRPEPLAFAEEVLRRDVESYGLNSGPALIFFDRGVIDALAMVAHAVPERRAEAVALAARYPYHRVAFFLPPWEEIYVHDDERDHTFAHAVGVYESLVAWYEDCGYEVVAVPKLSVAERCDHVLSALAASV